MLKSFYDPLLVEAGVDEVGRGCLAGPVVAAAVILPKNFAHQLINDSKKLNKGNRLLCEGYIKENAISWSIAEVSPQEIDQINILNASIKAMHLALDNLLFAPELILVDGNKFHPYKFIPYQTIVKGDSKFMSIAAASILAKCYRDQLMSRLDIDFPIYDWKKNMGYPTLFHRQTILEYGSTHWHRLSFKVRI